VEAVGKVFPAEGRGARDTCGTHRFPNQNDGRLSVRARTGEFAQLTDAEVTRFEQLYQECFMENEDA
jgi:hypothetical protein